MKQKSDGKYAKKNRGDGKISTIGIKKGYGDYFKTRGWGTTRSKSCTEKKVGCD